MKNKLFIIGFFSGIIVCSIIIKIFDDASPYDWILGILDKPIFQTHGICILLGLGGGYLIYQAIQGILNNYYNTNQELIQNEMKRFDKIINNLLKRK